MTTKVSILAPLVVLLIVFPIACSNDHPLLPQQNGSAEVNATGDVSTVAEKQMDPAQSKPAVINMSMGDFLMQLWPYTGEDFSGVPKDPVNLIFVGQADPVRIRAALMALDGDRSAFPFPQEPPFDQQWTDIVGGGVHTSYAEDDIGWCGSVVQLSLGDFGPLRFHLRLFPTALTAPDGSPVTIGAAHFEVQIPGTTDHQVLSWEIAEQVVVADFMRTGLLDPDTPVIPTGVINQAPSFREIPDFIYNLLPAELIEAIGGPPQPVDFDIPLPSDGEGMILMLKEAAPIPSGSWDNSYAVQFDQVIPRPFCSAGAGDYLQVTGVVEFLTTVKVNAQGHYNYHSRHSGTLMAVPLDLSSGTPVVLAGAFSAQVGGGQVGNMGAGCWRITSRDRQMIHALDGPELADIDLSVAERGECSHRVQVRCFEP
jgi:hypothetical protein